MPGDFERFVWRHRYQILFTDDRLPAFDCWHPERREVFMPAVFLVEDLNQSLMVWDAENSRSPSDVTLTATERHFDQSFFKSMQRGVEVRAFAQDDFERLTIVADAAF